MMKRQQKYARMKGAFWGMIKERKMGLRKIKGEHQLQCLMFPGKSGFFILKFYFHYFTGFSWH